MILLLFLKTLGYFANKKITMMTLGELFSSIGDLFASRITDKDFEDLQESVKALNYELSMLRYKDSNDEEIRLAYEYLRKRPFCAALFPYEKTRDIPPIEVHFDKDLQMCYVMHHGRKAYFPRGEEEKIVRLIYRFSIEDDDVMGIGYRQRSPHAYQSERFHIEEGDVLIDAGGGRGFSILDVIDAVVDEVTDKVTMDLEGEELEVLREAQEYLKAFLKPSAITPRPNLVMYTPT